MSHETFFRLFDFFFEPCCRSGQGRDLRSPCPTSASHSHHSIASPFDFLFHNRIAVGEWLVLQCCPPVRQLKWIRNARLNVVVLCEVTVLGLQTTESSKWTSRQKVASGRSSLDWLISYFRLKFVLSVGIDALFSDEPFYLRGTTERHHWATFHRDWCTAIFPLCFFVSSGRSGFWDSPSWTRVETQGWCLLF